MREFKFSKNTDDEYFSAPENARAMEKNLFDHVFKVLNSFGVKINRHALGIPDAHDDGGYCFHYDHDQCVWLVYSSERGKRSRVAIFQGGDDAAEFFILKMLRSQKIPSIKDIYA